MWVKTRLWPALAELALAFCGLLAGFLAATLGIAALTELLGDDTPFGLLGGPLITIVAVVVYAKLGAQATRTRAIAEPVASPLPKAPLGRSAAVVVGALAVALAGSFLIGILLTLVGMPVAEQGHVLEIAARAKAGEGLAEAAMLVLAALLLAPIAEELLFRDLLWRRVRAIAGPGLAYALSAFGFAAIHGNPAGLFIYAWLGVCFAYALQRTGRAGAAIAVHMGNNAYVLAALFFA